MPPKAAVLDRDGRSRSVAVQIRTVPINCPWRSRTTRLTFQLYPLMLPGSSWLPCWLRTARQICEARGKSHHPSRTATQDETQMLSIFYDTPTPVVRTWAHLTTECSPRRKITAIVPSSCVVNHVPLTTDLRAHNFEFVSAAVILIRTKIVSGVGNVLDH